MRTEKIKNHASVLMRSCFLVSALLVWTVSVPAVTDYENAEYNIKAAFLYKFANYVEWPGEVFPAPDSPIIIGVIGADSLAGNLEQMVAGRTVSGREIVVEKILPTQLITGVHILFIGRSETANVVSILHEAEHMSVLTVTESRDLLSLGSVINFAVIDNKVQFDVALPSAQRNNLRISARLLQVARNVIKESL